MKYLLDTCVISELVKSNPLQKVAEWMQSVPSENMHLSVITIGEIKKGLYKLPESQRKDRLTNWLNDLLEDYKERILDITLDVASTWGVMISNAEKKGTPVSPIDGLIAATAKTNSLILVTRNVADIIPCNIESINPWEL